MNKIKRLILSSAALLLFSGLAMSAPVTAIDNTGSNSSSSTAADDSTSTDSKTDKESRGALLEQIHQQAQADLQQAKENHKTHTEAERQNACDAHKAEIAKRMANSVTVANRLKGLVDKHYAAIKSYVTDKQLTVPNYDTLTAAADTAQANAQTSIDALTSLNVTIDCTSQNVASQVSSYRQAVASTRDALKSYRSAVIKVLTAVHGVSTAAGSSSINDSGQ